MRSKTRTPLAEPAGKQNSPSLVDQVANAVLYEGYILYPYRASTVKNRQRFNFGGLYPPAYSIAQAGADAFRMRTECLVVADAPTRLDVRVRFLHLVSREIGRLVPREGSSPGGPPVYEAVASVEVGGRTHYAWQEAIEREAGFTDVDARRLVIEPARLPFSFAASRHVELLRDESSAAVATVTRRQLEVRGQVELTAIELAGGLLRVRVAIENQTPLDDPSDAAPRTRDDILLQTLASTHTILGLRAGEFVSLLEPPEEFRGAAAACQNIGAWPVLVGLPGQRDTILSSPIILYDYPQIAPESAGDMFDGAEIDEILALRIMTLTDAEKREMRDIDERARQILERTEMMPEDQFMKLHGAIRGLRPAKETAP